MSTVVGYEPGLPVPHAGQGDTGGKPGRVDTIQSTQVSLAAEFSGFVRVVLGHRLVHDPVQK